MQYRRISLLFASPLVALLTACQPTAPRTLLLDGEAAYERADYRQAIDLLSNYLDANAPTELLPRARYARGLSQARLGDRPAAYRDLEAAAQAADPEVAWRASLVLGTLNFEDERWAAAARQYAAAAEKMPSGPPLDTVLWRLGQSQERSGQWREAAEAFRRLLTALPESNLAPVARRRLVLSADHFSIQCGVFDDADAATAFADTLSEKGLPSFVRTEPREGQFRRVVLVGRFATYDAAVDQLATVRRHVPDAILWP